MTFIHFPSHINHFKKSEATRICKFLRIDKRNLLHFETTLMWNYFKYFIENFRLKMFPEIILKARFISKCLFSRNGFIILNKEICIKNFLFHIMSFLIISWFSNEYRYCNFFKYKTIEANIEYLDQNCNIAIQIPPNQFKSRRTCRTPQIRNPNTFR